MRQAVHPKDLDSAAAALCVRSTVDAAMDEDEGLQLHDSRSIFYWRYLCNWVDVWIAAEGHTRRDS